jgi:hypothetical protein
VCVEKSREWQASTCDLLSPQGLRLSTIMRVGPSTWFGCSRAAQGSGKFVNAAIFYLLLTQRQ